MIGHIKPVTAVFSKYCTKFQSISHEKISYIEASFKMKRRKEQKVRNGEHSANRLLFRAAVFSRKADYVVKQETFTSKASITQMHLSNPPWAIAEEKG